jgi:hypothetical protein
MNRHTPVACGLRAALRAHLAVALAALLAVACGGGESNGVGGDVVAVDTHQDVSVTLPDGDRPPSDGGTKDAASDAVSADLPAPLDGGGPDTGPVPDVPTAPCVPGRPCDDGDPCTFNDRCDGRGGCAGEPYACDDGRACTDDRCDGFGDCRFVVRDGMCLIDGHCLADGASPASNVCVRCDASASSTAWTLASGAACDDGDPCTGADTCVDGACVPGDGPPECEDDDSPCTEVACTPGLGCTQVPVGGICDDGDACTGPGLCVDGVCRRGAPLDCNDANPCTADRCAPGVGCVHEAIPGTCDDGDACTLDDACVGGHCIGGFITVECHDGDPCTFDWCDPRTGHCLFTSEGNTSYCEDGSICTLGDRCRAGVCQPGAPMDCDDGNDCTEDSCREVSGCYHQPLTGGCCQNGRNICDDGNPCTDDLCVDGGSCLNVNNAAACDDFDACTSNDTCFEGACVGQQRDCDDDNECTADSCNSQTGCRHTPIDGACDDHNVCTLNDRCQFGQCTGNFIECADTNPCTDDICDPVAGCQHPFNTDPCEDGDVCTAPDACRNGVCVGPPNACDDGDPCTRDACVNPIGCTHQPASGAPCDDGIECTSNDRCVAGVCVGDTSTCVCPPPVGPAVVITSLQIGADGHPGNGLDLDANPNTCAPAGRCSGGINNAMAQIATLANPEIVKALDEGSFFLLLQHIGLRTDGQPYELAPWPAEITSESCAYQTTTCDFLLDPNGFTQECNPLVSLSNARISGSTFTAGGVGYNFLFNLPLLEGVELDLVLYNATLQGTVTVSGGRVTQLSGILGGAVPKQTIRDAILAVDPADLPISPSVILSLLDTLIRDDIDTDGNGVADAASIGLLFQAREARITGTQTD